jgi:hypothetical protein
VNPIVTRGLKTGVTMAAATTATMVVSSLFKSKSPWAGINAMATGIGVGGRRPSKTFEASTTPAGLGALVGGMLVWGLGYEAALAAAGRRSSVLTGALSALGGYAFDRLFLADHLVPNFRKTMGTLGTVAKYTALGLASAMSSRAIEQVGSVAARVADAVPMGAQGGQGSAGAASPGTEASAGAPSDMGTADATSR